MGNGSIHCVWWRGCTRRRSYGSSRNINRDNRVNKHGNRDNYRSVKRGRIRLLDGR